jgi:predicted DNA-binding transcriptional regulator AlpA
MEFNAMAGYENLPDSALVQICAFRDLLAISNSTVWRRAKAETDFPKPIKVGPRATRWRLGDIRKLAQGVQQ